MTPSVGSLEKVERKIQKKNTIVKDPSALMKMLFGDKSIKVQDCIETKTKIKISRKQACKSKTEYLEKDGFKKCTCCHETKEVKEFYKHDITKDGYRYYCIKCCSEDALNRYYKHKEEA